MLTLTDTRNAELKAYKAELSLGSLAVGVDNIHHDVFMSPSWTEQTRLYILDRVRQAANLNLAVEKDPRRSKPKSLDSGAWKRQLLDLLQGSLTRAKFKKNIEIDLLFRVALIKHLTLEITNQFSHLMLEAKEWVRSRGGHFEHSEAGHVFKARLADLQAGRRNVYRQVGQHIFQLLGEIEETQISRARHALFGEDCGGAYEILNTRLAFVEGGRDDVLFLENYVLLGNYQQDSDRLEVFQNILLEFIRAGSSAGNNSGDVNAAISAHRSLVSSALAARTELTSLEAERGVILKRMERGNSVLGRMGLSGDTSQLAGALRQLDLKINTLRARIDGLSPQLEAAKVRSEFVAGEQASQLVDYLSEPENARLLFDPSFSPDRPGAARRLDQWLDRIEQGGLLANLLASYELRNIYLDYCPPLHLQQLRKALVSKDDYDRTAAILKQFPARNFSLERIDMLSKKIRRYPREEARSVALRFAQDLMRLRRDLRNYERLAAAMERVHLVTSEKTRDISRLNNTLYEFVLSSEAGPANDAVVNHTVIKADVRGSTRITKDLLARGLNPATLFSLNFFEPVKKILDRYSAIKVFIEGDAIILAVNETESNRTTQRAVSKACALGRQLLAIASAYNERPEAADLPRLELGVGIAHQGSAPAYWVDSDSRIMISKALNLSDRLSSCSKAARRVFGDKAGIFRVMVFQPGMTGEEDEADEFLIRFNLNGIELNQEGFAKLSDELALKQIETECEMPWGRESVTFFLGDAPIGETLEPILVRRGFVRMMQTDGQIGPPTQRAYYEVCTHPKAFELVQALALVGSRPA
jgi:class 3 adenylate cyclase